MLLKLLSTFLIVIAGTAAFAQDQNPFQSIGKNGKILTLSNGKYDELFDQTDVQQIGNALINIRALKIVKLLHSDLAANQWPDNTSVTRFLSVDPMAGSFSMLTPYQYASNRPIDGIDLEGLEYLTYTINIDLGKTTGKSAGAITSSSYVWYNANQHNAHGPLGQGVNYVVNYNVGGNTVGQNAFFLARNASTLGISTEYGNYMGATSFFKMEPEGHGFTKQYDYDLPAVDQVDNLAKNHDMGYDALGAVGATSLFNDWGTTPVDEAALTGWNLFLSKSSKGSADPYNGQPVTGTERSAASRASTLFDEVVINKKSDISYWMQTNYQGEAQNHVNKGLFREKDTEDNYKLFLNKYMQQDDKGNWTRKTGMWNEDDQHNFTPRTPEQLNQN
jgi:hypothetical protein